MAGLYELSDKLRYIINDVIENGGEITPEQEEELVITKENFKDKVNDYCKAIIMTKSDVECYKNEKKRINDGQQVKSNLVERLKLRVLDALLEFGDDKVNKTTGAVTKTLDVGTFKLFTKNLTSFVENKYRKELLEKCYLEYINELNQSSLLYVTDEEEANSEEMIEHILGAINATAKAYWDSDNENNIPDCPVSWVDFTVDDLKCLNFEITFNINAFDIFTQWGIPIAQAYCAIPSITEINSKVKHVDGVETTLGDEITKPSLTIK